MPKNTTKDAVYGPYEKEKREFYEWMEENKIVDRIAERLYNQKYLLESDVIDIMEFDSNLDNPFYFFCGDIDIYKKDLEKTLALRNKQILEWDKEKNSSAILNFFFAQSRLISAALEECVPKQFIIKSSVEETPLVNEQSEESVVND